MSHLLRNLLGLVLAVAAWAPPQPAQAHPHRHGRRPQPTPPLLYLDAERPSKATWTVPQPKGPDRPVWRLHGLYWTWSDHGWRATAHPWQPWHKVRTSPKALQVIPLYVKAPPPDLSVLVTLLQQE